MTTWRYREVCGEFLRSFKRSIISAQFFFSWKDIFGFRVVDYFVPKANFLVSNLAWAIMALPDSHSIVGGNDASSYLFNSLVIAFHTFVIERAVYWLSLLSRVGDCFDFRNFFLCSLILTSVSFYVSCLNDLATKRKNQLLMMARAVKIPIVKLQ